MVAGLAATAHSMTSVEGQLQALSCCLRYSLLATMSWNELAQWRKSRMPAESGSQSYSGRQPERRQAMPADYWRCSPLGRERVPVRQIGRYHCAWKSVGIWARIGRMAGENCVWNMAT